jgi:hypothetical protein
MKVSNKANIFCLFVLAYFATVHFSDSVEWHDDSSPVMLKGQISKLIFAYDLAAGAVITVVLQRAVNCVQKFWVAWKYRKY